MAPRQWTELAAWILNRSKLLVSHRVPQPSQEAAEAWGDFLSHNVRNYWGEEFWSAVIRHWSKNHDEAMMSPQVLLDAYNHTRSQSPWREQEAEIRQEIERQRNMQMFGSEDGRRALPPAKSGQEAVEATKKRYRTLQSREARKRAGDPSQQRFGA